MNLIELNWIVIIMCSSNTNSPHFELEVIISMIYFCDLCLCGKSWQGFVREHTDWLSPKLQNYKTQNFNHAEHLIKLARWIKDLMVTGSLIVEIVFKKFFWFLQLFPVNFYLNQKFPDQPNFVYRLKKCSHDVCY